MRISKEAAPEGVVLDEAAEQLAEVFDVALVVVHGMGNAYRSQILLEWAEPLLQRMDWLSRDPAIGGKPWHGVTIHESNLTADVPTVTATVKFPSERARSEDPRERAAYSKDDDEERKVAILEARWSESFVPMTRAQIFRWAILFMWRTIRRLIVQFWGTMVLVAGYTFVKHLSSPKGGKYVLFKIGRGFVDAFRVALGFIAFVATTAFVGAVGIVMTPILPLLSPLLLIPWFKNVAQGVIDGVIESIGDVAAWKERPLRASAMRLVVRQALDRAKQLVGDGDVHLFAHSQGAAVATFALLEELTPKDYNVRRLTTVGAAVVLLGREKWRGRSDKYAPVAKWIERNTGVAEKERVEWDNHWAIWDPFSAGPIADTPRRAHERWRDAYFPSPNAAAGPEEHAVHNTSQPFLDHSMYFDNTIQVVEPTARRLLGDRFPKAPDAVAYVENRVAVIDKKSLGINMLAAVVIAALLPGLANVYDFLTWIVTNVAGWLGWAFGWAFGWLPSGPTPDQAQAAARETVNTLFPAELGPWGWVLASAFILFLLIWLNQNLWRVTSRAREWDRCPVPPKGWLTLTSLPRAAYVLAAAFCTWCAIDQWVTPKPDMFWLIIAAIGLLLIGVFVFAEPLVAPVPVVVASREHVDPKIAPPIIDDTKPRRLRDAVATDEFKEDLALRRKLLDPQGYWSRWWARRFHHWSPPQKSAA